MPRWKYLINLVLTKLENYIVGANLSEYHTGYRAFSRELRQELPLDANSDGFIFDNEILLETMWFGYSIGEVSCPTRYFPEASVINLCECIKYGIGVIRLALMYRFAKMHLITTQKFPRRGQGTA
jgi:hypothetical protein